MQPQAITRRICEHCGTAFQVERIRPSHPNWGKFCSRACRGAAQSARAKGSRADRYFWPRVKKTANCWVFKGRTDKDGYGVLNVYGGAARAHRYSWEIHFGPIPDGLWVLHHCDNPPCVRPDHLFLGTTIDNNKDRHLKGRTAAGLRSGTNTHPESYRGKRSNNARLTEDVVREIRARVAAGESHVSVAQTVGMSRATIGMIARRETWKDVE